MISAILRVPLDPLETRLLLDMSEQQYALTVNSKLMPCSPLDREFAPHLLQFHNFWDIFEYRLTVVLEGVFDRHSIQELIESLAQEIEVLDRNGQKFKRALNQIANDFSSRIFTYWTSKDDLFFSNPTRIYNMPEIIVKEFESLLIRLENYFEQRISEASIGQIEVRQIL